MTQHDQSLPWNIETLLVHGGRKGSTASSTGTPTVSPIYASSTYIHGKVEELDQAFSGKDLDGNESFVYARHGNPSTHTLEQALAQVEGGVGSVVFGSGMSAIHAALLAADLTPGTKIVASQDMYGPTIGLLQKIFKPAGVKIVLGDLCCAEAVELIRAEEPDVVYVETLSNPLVKLVDLDAISAAAREVGAVAIVDSTFTPPTLVRPIEHGFDLVIHSATKYISGHGDSTGGVVISAKNTLLNQLRNYSILLGAVLSPFEAHLMLRGLRTLALRIERQCTNAFNIANFLQKHPAIERVHYPGLDSHPQHELASRLLQNECYGGLLSFELKEQSRAAVFRFMNNLRICLPATSLGDVYSLVSYPPLSSHRTLTEQELHAMGIKEGCVRLSIGIEHSEDIIQDLNQALAAQ